MKEKLIIKNFGPIKSVELDLGRFNILVGEQATGKSTVAKVLAVCRYFSYIVGRKGLMRESNGIFYSMTAMDIPFMDGLEDWGISGNLKPDSYISYTCNDYQIIFDRLQANDFGVVEIKPLSSGFSNLLLELKEFNQDFYNRQDKRNYQNKLNDKSIAIPIGNIPYNFYKTNVSNIMDNPFYLPAERGLQSIFSLGKSSIGNISDSLFSQLAKLDEISRNYTNETDIEPLGIFYENRSGHGYIRKANETDYYSLFNAASGYQSTIPVVLAIKHYIEKKKKNKTFLIEEPELNLFPKAQNKLMQYIVDKVINNGSRVLLTTHSPYILTSLNNMMYAYQVGLTNTEKISEIIDKKYWINPSDVNAYRLLPDGTAKNILDEELKQLNAGELDEISRSINENWDKIADVEYSKHEN